MANLIVILIVVLVICSAGAFATYNIGKYFDEKIKNNETKINNFDDCVNSGNAVIGADPIRCIDTQGNIYLRNP